MSATPVSPAAWSPEQWLEEMDRRIAAVLGPIARHADTSEWVMPARLAREQPVPHWLLLPIWLEQEWGGSRRPAPPGWLAPVLWGQYALFLTIRIQDDLLDRQREDLRTVFLSDRFLLASLESYQRLPALGDGFWELYRNCLNQTTEGILEVGRLERRLGGFTTDQLALHARVCALFKIGSAALCYLYGRPAELRWISSLLDQLAIFSQIGDDLEDLDSDVAGGRYTWVANTILGAGSESSPMDAEAHRLGVGLMRSERGDVIVQQLRVVARAAVEAVPDTAPAQVHQLVGSLPARCDQLEQALHEARVRQVLGQFLPPESIDAPSDGTAGVSRLTANG